MYEEPQKPNNNINLNWNWKNFWLYLLLTFLAVTFIAPIFNPLEKIHDLSFSDFLNKVEQGQVKAVSISDTLISGALTDGSKFKTQPLNYPNLVPLLREKKIDIKVATETASAWLWNLISQVVFPILVFFGLWWLLMRQADNVGGRAMSLAKSPAKPISGKVNVNFQDVAGVDEAKEELKEIVDFLQNPAKFQKLGAKIPKGLLLMGAPGTGKTLLARAIAGEANVPFFSISGSDFVEMFVGLGAARVRAVFQQAKKQTPSIIFMDEIDAVGRYRGAGLGAGHDEREQTLNQLLVEMDGFDPKANCIVIAATNRPDILDPALLRPGRFDRQVVLDKPDIRGREEIIKIHMRGKPLAASVDIKVLAKRTPGFTGADIEAMLNEGAILAARLDKSEVTMDELEEAVDRILAGPQKKGRVISDKEKSMVAHHEAGHALLTKLLPQADPVHKISVLPRGMALGYTLQLPLQDKYLVTKSEALEKVVVFMGGRVAEEIFFGEMTSGAHNDLEQATEIAKRMVCEFGMSDLGPRTFGKRDRQIFLGRDIAEMKDYSEQTADSIDREVKNIVDASYARAKELLTKNREKLGEIAKVLIEKETLEGEDLENLLKDVKPT